MAGAEKDEASWTGFLKTQILMGNSTCKHPERPVKLQARDPTSGPALPFPTPRSARPGSASLRRGLALAARRWGRAPAEPRRTSRIAQQRFKNQKPEDGSVQSRDGEGSQRGAVRA